jgi:hypothetical protein
MITRVGYQHAALADLLTDNIKKQNIEALINTANMILDEQVAFEGIDDIELINWEEALAILGTLDIDVVKDSDQDGFLWRDKHASIGSEINFDTFKAAVSDAIESNLAPFNTATVELNKAMSWAL